MSIDQPARAKSDTSTVRDVSFDHCDLQRVDAISWIIRNRAAHPGDPDHIVAFVYEPDERGVEVIWMTETPLPIRYLTPESALDDLRRWSNRTSQEGRPVPIPHLPPRHPERC